MTIADQIKAINEGRDHDEPAPLDPPVLDDDQDEDQGDDEKSRPSAAVKLVRLAESRYQLGTTPAGDAYAFESRRPHIARMFREGRNGLRAELARQYFDREGKAAPQQALADALLILEGKAADATPEELHLRVAAKGGAVYIDAGDVAGTVYRITGGTWTTETTAPVKFRRTELTAALPAPEHHPQGAAGVLDLFDHLNVAAEDHRLVLAWLAAAMLPGIPHPILALVAEQGTAKSTATTRIVQMVDPSAVPLRTAPQGEEKWLTAAAGSWVVGLDNASHIPPWFSDALCRAVTGDGDVKRRLYTDGALAVVKFRRCVVLNGIDLGGLRGDLADRLVMVDLHRITEDRRRDETELNAMWETAHPVLFGALLDFTAQVHDRLPSVRLDVMPRMADFARVLAAVDVVAEEMGLPGGSALERYTLRSQRLAEESLQSDPFISALMDMAYGWGVVEKTSAEILSAVHAHMLEENEEWRAPRTGWPKSPRAVTGLLKRNIPQMLKTGWEVSDDGGRNKAGVVKWTIVQRAEERAKAYLPALPSLPSQVTGLKAGGLSENAYPAEESVNPPGGLSAGQAGYRKSTNPPENMPLTSTGGDSGDSGGSNPYSSARGMPQAWRIVLQALSTDRGITAPSIRKQFTPQQLEDIGELADVLTDMAHAGLVHRRGPKFIKTSEGAQAA